MLMSLWSITPESALRLANGELPDLADELRNAAHMRGEKINESEQTSEVCDRNPYLLRPHIILSPLY
jgi:hypothetical protein